MCQVCQPLTNLTHIFVSFPRGRTNRLTDLTHIVVSFAQGQTNRNIITNKVNSSFASLAISPI